MTIQKATFKECPEIQETRFAPYVGYTVFIINDQIVIYDQRIELLEIDVEHETIFEVIETFEDDE